MSATFHYQKVKNNKGTFSDVGKNKLMQFV